MFGRRTPTEGARGVIGVIRGFCVTEGGDGFVELVADEVVVLDVVDVVKIVGVEVDGETTERGEVVATLDGISPGGRIQECGESFLGEGGCEGIKAGSGVVS